MRFFTLIQILFLFCACGSQAFAADAADTVFLQGKIITADQSFSIQQALAVKNGRISALGTNDAIRQLADENTRVIQLDGKTVIPGLIDNHVHIVRGSRQWHRDVRLGGVHTRAEAKQRIAGRAKKLGPGEWVLVMGGYTPHQFSDNQQPFTRQELDQIAPDNPVYLQLLFGVGFVNTQALQAIGIDGDTEIAWLPIANDIDVDDNGQATGVVRGAAMRRILAKISEPDLAQAKQRAQGMVDDLHAMGLTSVIDAAGSGLTLDFYQAFEELDQAGELTLRVFSLYSPTAYSVGQGAGLSAELDGLAFFQPSDYFQRIGLGERLYNPIHDSMQQPAASAPEHQQTFAHLARQVAAKGYSLQQHATHPASMQQHLDAFEAINQDHPIRHLRWVFHHADGIDTAVIQRAKALGMGIASHSRRLISGNAFTHPLPMLAFGNPPLKTLQASGITWGLGTDMMVVNQSNPFYTLWWAVTGKAMNGDQLTDQTITREQALIAHTRSNAWMAFREQDLGSLEVGKLADLVVLDRDYLTLPADEIKRIKPVMTVVGGQIVYQK